MISNHEIVLYNILWYGAVCPFLFAIFCSHFFLSFFVLQYFPSFNMDFIILFCILLLFYYYFIILFCIFFHILFTSLLIIHIEIFFRCLNGSNFVFAVKVILIKIPFFSSSGRSWYYSYLLELLFHSFRFPFEISSCLLFTCMISILRLYANMAHNYSKYSSQSHFANSSKSA